MAYTLKTRRLKGKVRSNYPKHIFSFNAAVSNRFFFFFSFVSEVFCFQRGTTEINGISSAVLTVLKNDISQIQQQQVPETMSWLIRWPCCQHLSAERLSKKENCWQHVLWIIPAYTAERYCFSFQSCTHQYFDVANAWHDYVLREKGCLYWWTCKAHVTNPQKITNHSPDKNISIGLYTLSLCYLIHCFCKIWYVEKYLVLT